MAQSEKMSTLISIDDYLVGERDGMWRHEYMAGRAFAMAGASERHNIIKLNIAGTLNAAIADTCRVFDGDMKLRIEQSAEDVRFYYPDVFVSCEQGGDAYYRQDAVLIVEVLSPTTARYDRYEKFTAYAALPTLSEYLLAEQDFQHVEVRRRRTGWQREVFQAGASVTFESIGQAMTLDQIYRRIRF